jgi:putative phosphoribosyl transferase
MPTSFRDRTEAGQRLAKALAAYTHRPGVIVLALPRGGVPVAFEIARALGVPLDVFLVRKLGVPGHEELAMGAIASGGARVVNRSVVSSLGISEATMDFVAKRELHELQRRERTYRNGRVAPDVTGSTVILVDDGIATGATMRAAIQALRQLGAGRIVVATPTSAWSTAQDLQTEVDEFVSLLRPEDFVSVGQWYDNFTQTTDDEVRALLERARGFSASSLSNHCA